MDIFDFHTLVNLAIIIGVSVVVCRAVFSIPKITANLEEQTKILKLLAQKSGVEFKEFDEKSLSDLSDEDKSKIADIINKLKGEFERGEISKVEFETRKENLLR